MDSGMFNEMAFGVIEENANEMYNSMIKSKGAVPEEFSELNLRNFCVYYAIMGIMKSFIKISKNDWSNARIFMCCQNCFIDYCVAKGTANKMDAFEMTTTDRFIATFELIINEKIPEGI
jgi:hypothetical protein